MRFFSPALLLTALLSQALFSRALFAQQEIGLTLGSISGPARTTASGATLNFSNGVALQANYARFIKGYKFADVYGEIHFLASPQQTVDSTLTSATRDFASLYLTPGVRVKFYPAKLLSPWVVAGGGYALYEQSTSTIAGLTNGAPRHTNTGAFEVGGGLDYVLTPRLTFRAEARNFITGSPAFNTPVQGVGQSNFVVGGGIVFRLGVK